ncbi:hypothetical protein I6F11_20445 [Ensifer sp. NBAIM29]|nr:hypothetical protein [Ensifer sp. NBAIM29]
MQLTFSFERKRIMLEENEVTRGLVGRYVETYTFADGAGTDISTWPPHHHRHGYILEMRHMGRLETPQSSPLGILAKRQR